MTSIRTLALPARIGVLVLGLIAVSAAVLGTAQVTYAATSAASASVAQGNAVVFDQINGVRADAGVPALLRNASLDKVAAAWAEQQWKNGAMSHNPDYSKQIPSGWTKAGENVARGYTYDKVVAAWKASSGHYANMVRDYTDIGIGYYEGPDGNRYWSTVFALYPSNQGKTSVGATSTAGSSTSTPASSAPAAQPSSTPASSTPAASYPAEPAAPAGTALAVASPSFEGTSSGWSTAGGSVSASIFGPSTAVKGGKYALSITPQGSGRSLVQDISQNLTVGEQYTATIWVRSGSTSSVAGSLKLTALGGTAETATVNFSGGGSGWMQVTAPLTVQAAGHTGLRLQVALSTANVEYRIDSVSLVRTKNAPAPAAAQPAAQPAAQQSTPAPAATSTPKPAATQPAAQPAATTSPAASASPAPAATPAATAPAAQPSTTPTATPTPTQSAGTGINLGIIRIGIGG